MKTALLLTLATSLVASAAHAEVLRDVAYGEGDRNQLDLYLPDGVENPPVVLFIHGGRWFRNDKSQINVLDRADALMEAGIAVASMNYTYSTNAIWPAQKDDVAEALRFLSDHGADYGYDAGEIAVWGQSSGAHLALWAGIIAAQEADINLQGVVSWYAPSNLTDIAADRAKDDVPDRDMGDGPTPEAQLIGAPVADSPDLADAASPVAVISQLPEDVQLPPMLLMHGTQDIIVSPLQSDRLYDTLKDRGAEASLTRVEGASHGGELFAPMVPQVIDFLHTRFAD
ncbi:alpha/beta hydrolase [Oceanicola sp. D3]|uniref:alpha/beta hydrolase n=1 Tax=Oceanicola sp. D3 TaxID=2587163 RepID=UPI0011206994|nr:alpha/beta hydrolase [Oceanicola sp. D3]QDC09340.1 alpha/beta hydrolase [Oceanicola sp. D3]